MRLSQDPGLARSEASFVFWYSSSSSLSKKLLRLRARAISGVSGFFSLRSRDRERVRGLGDRKEPRLLSRKRVNSTSGSLITTVAVGSTSSV